MKFLKFYILFLLFVSNEGNENLSKIFETTDLEKFRDSIMSQTSHNINKIGKTNHKKKSEKSLRQNMQDGFQVGHKNAPNNKIKNERVGNRNLESVQNNKNEQNYDITNDGEKRINQNTRRLVHGAAPRPEP